MRRCIRVAGTIYTTSSIITSVMSYSVDCHPWPPIAGKTVITQRKICRHMIHRLPSTIFLRMTIQIFRWADFVQSRHGLDRTYRTLKVSPRSPSKPSSSLHFIDAGIVSKAIYRKHFTLKRQFVTWFSKKKKTTSELANELYSLHYNHNASQLHRTAVDTMYHIYCTKL